MRNHAFIGYEPRGSGFDSCQPHQSNQRVSSHKELALFAFWAACVPLPPIAPTPLRARVGDSLNPRVSGQHRSGQCHRESGYLFDLLRLDVENLSGVALFEAAGTARVTGSNGTSQDFAGDVLGTLSLSGFANISWFEIRSLDGLANDRQHHSPTSGCCSARAHRPGARRRSHARHRRQPQTQAGVIYCLTVCQLGG